MPRLTGRAALVVPIACAMVVALYGCGGSIGTAAPTGKPALRALAISGYHTQVLGSSYILPMMVATAPAGSPLAGLGRAVPLGRSLKGGQTRGLAYSSLLDLYYKTTTSGATMTRYYYTDSAGTKPAGWAKAAVVGASSVDTNYVSYPVTIDISADVTAGNLIAYGQGQVVFAGPSAQNTLKGHIAAPIKGISATFDMSMDASGTIGGSITVVENGLTSVVTGLSGSLPDGFTGNAVANPGNFTGTATIDLMKGTFTLQATSPSGLTCNASVDALDHLRINYNDGTSLSLDNAIGQSPSGAGTNSGGGSTSSYTITPVNGNPWQIVSVTPDGKMVGAVGTYNTRDYRYWATPTAAPQAITLDPGLQYIAVTGINSSGHMVGSGIDPGTSLPVLLYWSAYNQAPIRLASPATPSGGFQYGITVPVFIQSSDRIVATFGTQQFGVFVSYVYSGPTDTSPYQVQGGYVTQLTDGTLALGTDANLRDVVWPVLSSTATPTVLPEPASTSPPIMGPDGSVVVTDLTTKIVWYETAPSYTTKVALPPPTGQTNYGALGIGPTGHVLGWVATSNTSLDNEGVIWTTPTSAPVVLRTTDTPNVLSAVFETNSGALIVNCSDAPGVARYHYSVMTPK